MEKSNVSIEIQADAVELKNNKAFGFGKQNINKKQLRLVQNVVVSDKYLSSISLNNILVSADFYDD